MKPLRNIITMVCLVAAGIANADGQIPAKAQDAVNPSTAADLQLLQGTWEGFEVGDKEASKNPDSPETGERKPNEVDLEFLRPAVPENPRKSRETITITITGNSFHFHRDTNFWFETTIALPPGTDPKQLHATIKDCPSSQADSIGKIVGAIFKIEDGTLTLAAYNMPDEPPKTFASATSRYVLKKIQPQTRDAEPPKSK